MTRDEILASLLDHTQSEVAELAGLTRQRVNQLALKHGVVGPRYNNYVEMEQALGKMPDVQVAKIYGVSAMTVGRKRAELGLSTFAEIRPDRCTRCDTQPYAKGMCRACWTRWRRKVRTGISCNCPVCGSGAVKRTWRWGHFTLDCLECRNRWDEEDSIHTESG